MNDSKNMDWTVARSMTAMYGHILPFYVYMIFISVTIIAYYIRVGENWQTEWTLRANVGGRHV
jgi:hypothetical protein